MKAGSQLVAQGIDAHQYPVIAELIVEPADEGIVPLLRLGPGFPILTNQLGYQLLVIGRSIFLTLGGRRGRMPLSRKGEYIISFIFLYIFFRTAGRHVLTGLRGIRG